MWQWRFMCWILTTILLDLIQLFIMEVFVRITKIIEQWIQLLFYQWVSPLFLYLRSNCFINIVKIFNCFVLLLHILVVYPVYFLTLFRIREKFILDSRLIKAYTLQCKIYWTFFRFMPQIQTVALFRVLISASYLVMMITRLNYVIVFPPLHRVLVCLQKYVINNHYDV